MGVSVKARLTLMQAWLLGGVSARKMWEETGVINVNQDSGIYNH